MYSPRHASKQAIKTLLTSANYSQHSLDGNRQMHQQTTGPIQIIGKTPRAKADPQRPRETLTVTSPFAYLRIWQIVGDRKRKIEPLLPIGRSTFLAKVKSGEYPQPVKLGERTTAWRKSDIMALLDSFGGGQGAA